MKRKLFLIMFLLGSSLMNQAWAQTAEGNWYTPLRNKFLHIRISTDSIVLSKCSFDSINRYYGSHEREFKIEKKIHTTYIVSSVKDTLTAYYIFGFTADLANGKNYMNIESMNNPFSSSEDAERAIPEFEKNPIKIVFLKKHQIDKIKQGKDLSSMTVNEFKKFAEKMLETNSINEAYAKKKYTFAYLYSESNTRLLLSDLGFNSLVKGDKFDAMLDTFYANPETQPLLFKMAGIK